MNRDDFPMLVNHPELVYLDSANTTLKPRRVVQAVSDYYESYGVNIGRASYDLAERATAAYQAARQKVAEFINAQPDEIIFTHSATYAINQAAQGLADKLRPGDVILLTNYEHNSNILVWQTVARRSGARVVYMEDDPKLAQVARVKIFAYSLVSNITGQIFNYNKLAADLRRRGGLVVVDATQAISKLPIDVRRLDCDLLAFSSHKLYGPSGVGVLYAHAALQPQLQPLVYGSQTFAEVSKNDFQLLSGVEKFEPGTPNIEGVIGLGAALDYLGGITMSQVQAHDQELVKYTLRKLKSSDLAQYLVAPPRRQVGIFSLAHPKLHPHDFGLWLSQRMVAVRAGKACSDILMQQLGLGRGVVRLSFGLYTRPADIDAFIAGYQQIIKELDG